MLKLILEPILGSERPKRAKMSPKEPSGASKNQKAAFSKTLKNLQFLLVFGSKGPPREPQETQKSPKRNPKRTKTTNKKIKN